MDELAFIFFDRVFHGLDFPLLFLRRFFLCPLLLTPD